MPLETLCQVNKAIVTPFDLSIDQSTVTAPDPVGAMNLIIPDNQDEQSRSQGIKDN